MGRKRAEDRSTVTTGVSPRGIRLSDEDYQTIKEAASINGEGWTTFMRRVALASAKRVIRKSSDRTP